MGTFNFSILIGGFAFFFLGLRSTRKGIELVAGDRLRAFMGRIAGNRFAALFFGALITFILQSSGATSAMLVNFAETGLMSLFQATAVLLGSDIGTTFVVILLSIRKITDISLSIIAIGFFWELIARSRRFKNIGAIILGFGLVFYGMFLMAQAAEPLKQSGVAMNVFAYLADNPLAAIIIAALISAAIHSAATIGIAIALAFAGTISFEAAIPIVLGANVGTCVTAILAGFGSGVAGRRVALAHTISKVIGVAAIYPFIPQLAGFIDKTDIFFERFVPAYHAGVAAHIAIAHIMFNIALALVFVPVLKPLVRLVEFLMPMQQQKEETFGPKYLDKSALETPPIAFAYAKREIMRIAIIANRLFENSLKMFSRGEDYKDAIELTDVEDDKIDKLEKAVRFYLAEISAEKLSDEQAQHQLALVSIASDLEEIGDIISKDMVQLAEKKGKWHRLFSDDGWQDLRNFQNKVVENFTLTISLLTEPSKEIADKIFRHEDHMNEVEQRLRQAHITRLNMGLKESFETSSIHLDILANLRRINSKLTHIASLAMEAI